MASIKINSDKIKGQLSVFLFLDTEHPEKDVWVAYCPELDLAGYDHGKDAAKKSLEYVLADYFDYALQQGTLEEDLLAHGWRRHKNGVIVEPTYKAMMKAGKLEKIFSQEAFSKYSIPVKA